MSLFKSQYYHQRTTWVQNMDKPLINSFHFKQFWYKGEANVRSSESLMTILCQTPSGGHTPSKPDPAKVSPDFRRWITGQCAWWLARQRHTAPKFPPSVSLRQCSHPPCNQKSQKLLAYPTYPHRHTAFVHSEDKRITEEPLKMRSRWISHLMLRNCVYLLSLFSANISDILNAIFFEENISSNLVQFCTHAIHFQHIFNRWLKLGPFFKKQEKTLLRIY